MADLNSEQVTEESSIPLQYFLDDSHDSTHTKTKYYEIDATYKLSCANSYNTIHINVQSLPF